MDHRDLSNIFFKILLTGSIVSQLVFTFYKLFFDQFETEDIYRIIFYIIADVIFSFVFLLIPFSIALIFATESRRKRVRFNFKKHGIIQAFTLVFLGFLPIIKELSQSDGMNIIFYYAMLHLLISYLAGYLYFENFKLKILN
jgi:hypothetical protein